jgi:hypothetical protein
LHPFSLSMWQFQIVQLQVRFRVFGFELVVIRFVIECLFILVETVTYLVSSFLMIIFSFVC